ncbi:MAG: TolC family protein [Saprospiraceae bacterium]
MKKQIAKVLLCAMLSLILLIPANAQVAIDLKAALQYTIDNHSKVQQALIDVQLGEQTLRESVSTGLPQIKASSTIINNLALRTSLIPAEFLGGPPGEFAQLQFGTNWNGNAGVELNQMIFNKQWLLALEATKKLKEFYAVSLDQTKETVIYETAKLYYQIQLTKTQRGILQANLSQIEGLLTVTEKQFQNGMAKKIDVDRLQVQSDNLTVQLSNLDLQLQQLELALKFAMQMPLETDIVLTDTISEQELAYTNNSILQPAFQSRPALGILQVQQELYDLDLRRWRAGYFPTVNFFANYTYEWQANNFGEITDGQRWTDYSQIGLRFNFPIFDGFYKDSQKQMAILNKMKVAKDHSYTLFAYQVQYQSALSSIQLNKNNLQAVTNTRKVAEEVYRVAQNRYKEGIAPITELLDAETSMREAQSNYIATLGQLKLSEIDLLHANGKLMDLVR